MMTDYDDGVKTIVELPDAQLEALASICRREGISRAEAIRRAVEKLVAGDVTVHADEDLRGGFGLWRGRNLDGRAYVEAIRADWEESVAQLPP